MRPVIPFTAFALGLGGRAMAQTDSLPPARLDHIILYTGSLEKGLAEFVRLTGVTPVRGGQHPGRGTQNALVSLGGNTYLELLAPIVDTGPALPLKPLGWAIGTDSLTVLRAQLRKLGIELSEPSPGSRRTPSGALLTWRAAAIGETLSPYTPFFIEWGEGVPHPSATSPGGCSLESFSITEPAPELLRTLSDNLKLPVRLHFGAEPGAMLTLRCPKGSVSFTR